MKTFYITTAIDYVNAAPHIGHAYEKIIADTIARWHRLNGEDVFFLTGTDENAQKNEQAAREKGVETKRFVDVNSKKFEELCKKLNISNNDFIKTTEKRHVIVAQNIFKKVYEKSDIYKGFYEGYYCEGCEAFLTEKELVDGKCPEHNKEPIWLKEESYFFKLSKYQDKILELLKSKDFVIPESKRNEMVSRLENEGLKDISVSRNKLKWGIDVPINKNHKIYVWFDALINYVSAIGYPNGNKFKKYWPADVHLIGKGINWFHSVIWPGILFSAGMKISKHIVVHGYLTVNGQKIGKSLDNVIDPINLVNKYGVDELRYFLIREIPFGEDGDFSEDALKNRINNELANDLGNLVSRSLTLAEKFKGETQGKDELSKKLNLKLINEYMDKFELHNALSEIWKFVNDVNKYVNDKQPWNLEGKELSNVLYNLLESLRIISILVSPFMPETSEKINKQLGIKEGKLKNCKFSKTKYKIKKTEHLFEKIK
ncbi:MAG: methionine--tRNA ligase [Candidatus Woesearchaeota archaeon]|nr:methionine--tRNA ligase [Candidatus Woesearchaeota archaeon]